jgi:hypothetical protein
MIVAEAMVATDRADRYLVQLCKHFAHKVPAEWSDHKGFADFGWGTCTLVATEDGLALRAAAPDAAGLDRVKHVVADHTERFGSRDNLTVVWQPVAE